MKEVKEMSKLRDAIDEELKWGKTWNGEDTLITTGSKNLDLFGRAGSMRASEIEEKTEIFDEAYDEDANIAMKLLFYIRDIRGGYGERDFFNQVINHVAINHPASVEKNIWAISEFGRAKDLYSLIGTPVEEAMWDYMKQKFNEDIEHMEQGKPISLLAKWLATPDSKSTNTKNLGKLTAKKLGYDFKHMSEYKKKLRKLRKYLDIPEIKMAANQWDQIDYSKVASRSMLTHKNAFKKHDGIRYEDYVTAVKSGEAEMHMDTNTPYDVILKAIKDYSSDLEEMWKQLPDMVSKNALVMCDTSGSMTCRYGNKSAIPMVVAFSLALYIADRNKGDLKNLFMTFSSSPNFVEFGKGTLKEKYKKFEQAPWGGSTDLEAAFNTLLNIAINNKLTQEDMPEAIIIVSDMQINCVKGIDYDNRMTFYDKMSDLYKQHGYNMPAVTFWNVNAVSPAFHASHDTRGASLVSGYSVNILKQVLENIGTTPFELMMKVVNSERYKDVQA